MIAYIDANGKIVAGDQLGLLQDVTHIPSGAVQAVHVDDAVYPDVWGNQQDYTIQNGTPVHTPIPDATKLANAQKGKIAQLTQSFNASMLNGFTSTADGTSRTYAIDPVAMSKWTGALANINSGKVTASITIKDFNGNKVALTPAQFQQMASDGFTYFNNQEQHLWTLEDNVNAATTVSAVNAIVW